MQRCPDAALKARAAAAHELLCLSPGVDRFYLLAAVVWPVDPGLKTVEQVLDRHETAAAVDPSRDHSEGLRAA
jgi:hypothetical protein